MPCAMFFSALWATSLAGYGSVPAILAEARVFQLGAIFSSACPGSLLLFLYCEARSFWVLGSFRLRGFGRGWF